MDIKKLANTKFAKSISRIGLSLSLLCLCSSPAQAAVINAASIALSDVQAAVNSSANGDTVAIPAGNTTWGSPLLLNKCITLQGAGTNNTIVNHSQSSGYAGITVQAPVDQKIRITGIQFNFGGWQRDHPHYAIHFASGICTGLRIDHCLFFGGNTTIFLRARAYGVVDHCSFIDGDEDIAPWMDFNTANPGNGGASWTWPINPGHTDTLVVEDCYFKWNGGSLRDEVVYGQAGARCTFRYNTVESAYYMNCFDAHGYFNGNPVSHSTVLYEIYNNTFNVPGGGRLFNLRGGRFIVFSNNLPSSASIQLKNEWVSTYGSYNPAEGDERIESSHFYNNRFGGSIPSGQNITIESGSEPYVLLNTHYFARPIQSGDVFYPYTPLVYPHPLVSGSSGNTNPVISVTPSAVDVVVNQGATTNVTIRVQNANSNILVGSASLSVTNPFTISGSGVNYRLNPGVSTNFTLSYTHSGGVAGSATLILTGGGGATISLLGGLPKTYVECVGDSLTRGGASTTTNFVAGGYRLKLYQLMTNAGLNAVLVGTTNDNSAAGLFYPQHDGYGGYEIGDIASSYQVYARAIHAPDYVLLQCGLNDFRHNNTTAMATNRLDALITQIYTNFPNAKIIVADMNPWNNLEPTNSTMNTYYNPYIPTLVQNQAALGRSVYLADMRQPYMTVADVQADNTHFTQTGYNKMATNWMSVISTITSGAKKPTPPTITSIGPAGP